jgi:hypothetical protein
MPGLTGPPGKEVVLDVGGTRPGTPPRQPRQGQTTGSREGCRNPYDQAAGRKEGQLEADVEKLKDTAGEDDRVEAMGTTQTLIAIGCRGWRCLPVGLANWSL